VGTAILANGINLVLIRIAKACLGVSLTTLSRVATRYIRDENYSTALAEVVNHHHQIEFAGY
jgi:TnpA family transposase